MAALAHQVAAVRPALAANRPATRTRRPLRAAAVEATNNASDARAWIEAWRGNQSKVKPFTRVDLLSTPFRSERTLAAHLHRIYATPETLSLPRSQLATHVSLDS
jgi:hypothetical protein